MDNLHVGLAALVVLVGVLVWYVPREFRSGFYVGGAGYLDEVGLDIFTIHFEGGSLFEMPKQALLVARKKDGTILLMDSTPLKWSRKGLTEWTLTLEDLHEEFFSDIQKVIWDPDKMQIVMEANDTISYVGYYDNDLNSLKK